MSLQLDNFGFNNRRFWKQTKPRNNLKLIDLQMISVRVIRSNPLNIASLKNA